MNTSSLLYKELSEEALTGLYAAVFPEETITDFALLSGGLFNTTYRVRTDRQDTVLRLGPVNRHLLLPFEEKLMDAEGLVDGLCRENGVPASEVLVLDTTKTRLDRDFMIVKRIPSVALSEVKEGEISPENRREISKTCGELTKRLHRVEGERFGRISSILCGRGKDCWSEALLDEIDGLIRMNGIYKVFPERILRETRAAFVRYTPLLDEIKTPRLVHADLWSGNILVQKGEDGWYRVAAIIDGDRAFWGDPNLDTDSPWMVDDAFLEGYGEKPFPPSEKRRLLYLLLFSLIDAYVWRVEYKNDQNYEEQLPRIDALLEKLA